MNNIRKPIIDSIIQTVEGIPGWCPTDELFALYVLGISVQHLTGDFLEIGAFCGKSTTVLAMAAEKVNANLYSVDLFPNKADWFQEENGTYNFRVQIKDKIYTLGKYTFWEEPYREKVLPVYNTHGDNLEKFVHENLSSRKLDHVVTLIKGTSTEFVESFNKRIKLAFIDGDHSYEAVKKDIQNVENLLVSGGYILFDDAFATYPENDKAIEELIINSGKYQGFQQLTRKCFVAKKK